jgi:DNA-binding response OmpR family regulator
MHARPATILLVARDPHLVALVEMVARDDGDRVVVAVNWEQALACAAADAPNLALIEPAIAGSDPRTAIARLRTARGGSLAVVMLALGSGAEEDGAAVTDDDGGPFPSVAPAELSLLVGRMLEGE